MPKYKSKSSQSFFNKKRKRNRQYNHNIKVIDSNPTIDPYSSEEEFEEDWVETFYTVITDYLTDEGIEDIDELTEDEIKDEVLNKIDPSDRYRDVVFEIDEKEDPFLSYRSLCYGSKPSDMERFVENLRKGIYPKEYKGMGTSWSYEKETAKPYYQAKGDYEFVITIELLKDDIDWEKVIMVNTNPYFLRTETKENEIPLPEGTSLRIVKVDVYEYKNRENKEQRTEKDLIKTFDLSLNPITKARAN